MELPPMKTGFNNVIEPKQSTSHEEVMILLVVFMQNALHNASEYVKYSGRNVITPTDVIYSLKYEAFNFCKRKDLKSYLEEADFEIYEEGDEEEESDEEESDEDESKNEFKKADSDTNKFCKDMNDINEFWDNWTPTDPLEATLKRSVDKSIEQQHILSNSNEDQVDRESDERKKV